MRAGRVRVNARTVRDPAAWVDEQRDALELDGRRLQRAERIVVALHKPVGCVTTRSDTDGRATVYDHLRDAPAGLRAIGRLDLDTSGLLLFTNDTALAERIASPAAKVAKTYELRTRTRLSDAQLAQLEAGVELADGRTLPARAERIAGERMGRWLRLAIREGRNRQIRRMVHALGGEVVELRRVAIGGLRLGELPCGRWRKLDAAELPALGV